MKRVICIDNDGYSQTLTIGKEYDVENDGADYYTIKSNDKGREGTAYKRRFRDVKDNRKIIGYLSPIDMFDGQIKKGTIFKAGKQDPVYWPENLACNYVPREIAEQWEPVYEEEKIKFGKYIMEVTDGVAKFGCQYFDIKEIAAIRRLLHPEVEGNVVIQGVQLTPKILDSIIQKLNKT